ncbi:DUF2591 family protein [Xenorhabdus sp. Vera]|uniref:phage protein NinX family protein n=1 Tax=Xenorhabdus koppenhoeferi TaxID=351659 RepID=UPI00199D8B4C|nr:phage protein NinX family protein [Xenorhabdus sp. Vera]MBD2811893.1 DUF2591 family protein [Xenorhabdus sp. Vera]
MKLKTSELTGRALDWAVGLAVTDDDVKCDGQHISVTFNGGRYIYSWNPTTNWEQCGQLIERYTMDLTPVMGGTYCAGLSITTGALCPDDYVNVEMYGATPQIAICRAVVAAQLGDEVEIPDELLEGE